MKHNLLKAWLMLCLLTVGMRAWADHTLVKASDMVSGEKYIITAVYNEKTYYLAPASFAAGGTGCGTYSSDLTDAAAWTFTKNGDNWTISTEVNGTKYYLSHTSANNGVQSTTTSATYTIAASTTGSKTVKMTNNSRVLSLYQGTNWRCYTSSSGVQTITLYKVNSSTPSYTLSFASNTKGTFSAKVDGNAVTSGSKVEAGKTVTLTAEPKDGYVFNAWNVYKTANQYSYVTVAGNNTFTMPSEAVTVDAYFVEGKTIPNAEVSVAAGTYRGAQSVTITNLDENEYSYYYTLDGSTPEIDGGMEPVGTTQEYTGAINITESCTLSILTTDLEDSKVNTYAYVIEYPYTVTIEEPVNGTLTVMYGETPVHSGDQFYKGDKITATATPADGYKFRNIQFTDATNHTFTASNIKEWNIGNHDVTISATFDEIQYYTVAFSVNGTTVQSDVLEENTAITAPAVEDINGKKFMGWVKSTVVVDPENEPTYETISKATENVTYVAVFATGEGDAEESWVKVTDASNLAAGDIVTLVSSAKVDYNSPGTKTKVNGYVAISSQNSNNWKGVGVTIENDKLTSLNNVQSFTLTATSSDTYPWAFCYDSKYLYAAGSTSNNYLKSSDNLIDAANFSIAIADGVATIVANVPDKDSKNLGKNTLLVNGSYNSGVDTANPIFTCYASTSTQTKPSIYKKEGGATYSDFTTAPLGTGTISISKVGYTTYFTNREFAMPEGLEGYVVTPENETSVTLIKAFNGGETVPASTALLVKGDEGSHVYNITNTGATFDGENYLHGNLTAGTIEAVEGASKYYKLLNGSKGLGWYLGDPEGGVFSLGANKAYLALTSAQAKAVSFLLDFADEDTEDAIKAVKADSNEVIYNLAGQRINKMQKGINIVNGKKILK